MKFFARLLNPRFQFFFFAVLALFVTGLVAFCSPEQFPIVRYKLSLGMLAAVIAVFFDMAAFPYASPDSYLDDDWRKTPDADRLHTADFPLRAGAASSSPWPACAVSPWWPSLCLPSLWALAMRATLKNGDIVFWVSG